MNFKKYYLSDTGEFITVGGKLDLSRPLSQHFAPTNERRLYLLIDERHSFVQFIKQLYTLCN